MIVRLDQLVSKITDARRRTPVDRASVVGISGIDASGKGFVSSRLAAELESRGYRVALIGVDGWLNLPHVRFKKEGSHFYKNALRLDEMFADLVVPLRTHRSIDLTMDFAEETANEFHSHTYSFSDIDIILLEGIFIFQRKFVHHFDLKVWIESSFETALGRAVSRSQENLSPEATTEAYNRIYFPAQREHFRRDDPRSLADIVYSNE